MFSPRQIAGELQRRQRTVSARYEEAARLLLEGLHPKQRACVESTASQVAAKCTRRAGKSSGTLRGMVYTALTVPNSRQLYVNQTFPECERVAWIGNNRDGLLSINEDYKLGAKPHGGKLRLTFPNESIIELAAADNERQIAKARGGAYHKVVIDEAQKAPHLGRFVIEVLGPAMTDFGGQIVLTGTPSRDCAGFFYEITRDDELPRRSGWDVHEWSVLDNPFFGETVEGRYERTIARALRDTGLPVEDPSIQREWFGKWVKEDARFVYDVHKVPAHELCFAPPRYKPNGFPDLRRAIEDLPTEPDGGWSYALGVDIGYSPDPFAFAIWAYSRNHPTMYEVASWSQDELIPDQQAEVIMGLMEELPFVVIVGDAGGGGKAIVRGWQEGWLNRYPIPMEEAKKSDKATHIEFINNDIRTGRLKLREGSYLESEMRRLVWLPIPDAQAAAGTGKLREDKRTPNHCCDAALYAHRHTAHYRYEAPEPEPAYGTPEYWRKIEEEREQELAELIDHEQRYL